MKLVSGLTLSMLYTVFWNCKREIQGTKFPGCCFGSFLIRHHKLIYQFSDQLPIKTPCPGWVIPPGLSILWALQSLSWTSGCVKPWKEPQFLIPGKPDVNNHDPCIIATYPYSHGLCNQSWKTTSMRDQLTAGRDHIFLAKDQPFSTAEHHIKTTPEKRPTKK